jgi:protein involved in polysaccharide export with SLBB domain
VSGISKTVRGLADLSGQQAAAVIVNPGDVVRFNPVFTDRDTGPVLLAGEFVRPGYYDILRGETLSELLARAGGLNAQAYPYGAVFTRESVKRAEREGFIRAARELDAAAIAAAAREDVGAGAVAAMREITAEIAAADPVGRVVIEADPTVLQVRPDLDVVLQPGDAIFMPKRPNSVLVIGDVLNPGAKQFLPGTRAERYIAQAGGFQQSADQDRVYLVYPNGVAEPLSVSVWNYSALQIPPGSTIVAPKDPAPFDLLRLTSEVASIVSQIAVTLASLAVITD